MQLENKINSSFKYVHQNIDLLDPETFKQLPVSRQTKFYQSLITHQKQIEMEKRNNTQQNNRRKNVIVLQNNIRKDYSSNNQDGLIKRMLQNFKYKIQNLQAVPQVQKYKICYYVFVTKLKELFEYSDNNHRQRIYLWMYLYIKMTNPDFKHNLEFIKNIHKEVINKSRSIKAIVFFSQNNLAIRYPIFNYYMDKFEDFFPQTQAVLKFFSINNLEKNSQQYCQIAKQFLAKLITSKTQKLQQVIRQEWTRYQYLTYVAFVSIQKDNIMRMNKDQFENFANDSFGGDVQKVWHKHISYKQTTGDWKLIYLDLIRKWKFSNQVIKYEMERLNQFFQQKQLENTQLFKQSLRKPSTFQKFLAERQMIDLKRPLRILTDKFQLESKTFKFFILDQPFEQVNSKSKKTKWRSHSVYLIAQFQMSSTQKYYLKSLRQQLLKLPIQFKSINHSAQGSQAKHQESNHESSAIEQSEIDDSKDKYSEYNIQEFHDSIQSKSESQKAGMIMKLRKLYKNDEEFQKEIFKNSYSKEFSMQQKDLDKSLQNQKDNQPFQKLRQTTQNKTIHKKQMTFCEVFKKDKLIKEQQNINASLQSTEVSFTWSQQIQNKNQKAQQNHINYSKKRSIDQLQGIEEQINAQVSDSEPQDQISNSINQIEELKSMYSNIQVVNTDQPDKFIRTLVSEEEECRLQSCFRRKILEFRLMSPFNKNNKKSNGDSVGSQGKKAVWIFLEEVKFVSFLIVNNFALSKQDYIPDFTFSVMSEFIESKTPIQCTTHHKHMKVNDNINATIAFLIKKHKMPSQSIKKQVNWLKQSYYQIKGNIFDMKKINKSKNKVFHKTIQELIIEKLEQKPLIFNVKTDYLAEKQQGNWYEQTVKKIRLVEKQRYLKCLEMCLQESKYVHKKKMLKFASEIFKERDQKEQTPLLQKYHSVLLRKHETIQKILKNEKDQNKKKEVKKNKVEMQRECNKQFMLHFCERIQTYGDILQCQILQDFIWLKDKI